MNRKFSWMSNVKEPLPTLCSVLVLAFVQENELRIADCRLFV